MQRRLPIDGTVDTVPRQYPNDDLVNDRGGRIFVICALYLLPAGRGVLGPGHERCCSELFLARRGNITSNAAGVGLHEATRIGRVARAVCIILRAILAIGRRRESGWKTGPGAWLKWAGPRFTTRHKDSH